MTLPAALLLSFFATGPRAAADVMSVKYHIFHCYEMEKIVFKFMLGFCVHVTERRTMVTLAFSAAVCMPDRRVSRASAAGRGELVSTGIN